MNFLTLLGQLSSNLKELTKNISKMSPEVEAEKAKHLMRLREHLKKIISNQSLTNEEVLRKLFWLYYLNQRHFRNSKSVWGKYMSYWDFNFHHICAIVQQMRKFPQETIILSPIAGNCFLEAILERLGYRVLANDIKERDFTFMTAPISRMDGMAFVSSFMSTNPSVPFVLLMSWAPPMIGHDTPEIGTNLMQFAARTTSCQCVFHISEGRGGCTDVEETFNVIDRSFREVWQFGRYPSLFEVFIAPLRDALFCLVPVRK